ncbi:hypothetical protein LB503_010130 [Fusarium chuoi]|nr:hypothetical protein LB503_010130 [Fusarium chuoi]
MQWVLVVTYMVFTVIAASAGKYGPNPTDGSVPHDHWIDKASISSLESLKVNAFGHSIQPIAIIMIEGYRGRNKLTPLGLPALWLMLIQYAGIGITMPLYYLVYTLISDVELYWWPLRRFVPLRRAKHILSAYVMSEAIHFGLVLSTIQLSNHFGPYWFPYSSECWDLLAAAKLH